MSLGEKIKRLRESNELINGFNFDDVSAYVDKVMNKYLTETAQQESVKCDVGLVVVDYHI